MPEGPLGAPRLTNVGPLSRSTEEEIRMNWDPCPESGKEKEICAAYKFYTLAVLENEGFFAQCDTLPDINSGSCVRIARQVFEEVRDGVRVMEAGTANHVWLKYNGRHYDAEAPTGVPDALDLPFFNRIPPENLLRPVRVEAEAMGEEPPEDIRDIIKDSTERFEKELRFKKELNNG